jgi:LPXTG-motif cell wall-anchored protein
VALLLGSGAAAHAAEPEGLGQFTLPAGTARVWVELEQSGLAANAVSVRAQIGGSTLDVPMTATTFGLHGEFAATQGQVTLTILPGVGAPAARPDLALTVLDANGLVLQGVNMRIAIPKGPESDGEQPQPAGPDAEDPDGDQNRGAKKNMARTGGDEPTWLIVAGALLVIAGGTVYVLRRTRASREGAAR